MTTLASAATGSRWKVNSSDEGMSLHDRLVRDVRCGMFAESPTLPPRWFYDCIGSRLFERITMLPEYYPTRRETEILAERADEIAHQSGASTLVEFGSGTSTKTTLLLDAFTSSGRHLLFVPIDAFAGGIQRFGFDAKRYALWAAIVAMMSVLAIIGAFALHRSWTTGRHAWTPSPGQPMGTAPHCGRRRSSSERPRRSPRSGRARIGRRAPI